MSSDNLPLSLSQLEVWRDQCAWPGSAHLNLGGSAFFEGPLDLPRLRLALSQLVAENAALRLVVQPDGTQHLLPDYEPRLELIDMGRQEDPRQAMRNWWQQWMHKPFVLEDGTPPWRFALLRANDLLHGGTIQFHHLIMDGWGTTQVMKRWSAIYNRIAEGDGSTAPSDDSYLQFIEESHAYRQSDAFMRDAAFWRAQLPVLPDPLVQRRQSHTDAGGLSAAQLVVASLPRAEYEELERHAASTGVTPFNFFLAAIALYFSRIGEREQVLIGVPTRNRSGRRYRDTMGMFVGVLGINITVSPEMTAATLVASVGVIMRAALRHPRYPLSELARDLEVVRSGRDGLFDVLLSFERQDYQVAFGDADLVGSRQLFSGSARYPLGITVCEFDARQDLELVLEGSAAYFAHDEVHALAGRLWHVVRALQSAPERRIADLSVLPADEFHRIVHERHAPIVRHLQPRTYVAAFEHHAADRPDAVCLVWDGGQMDYRTLNRRANQLAHRLVGLGAGRDRIVAVAMPRGPDLVVAMLAIAKAGGAYLPLDPDAPLARLAMVLQESAAAALLVQQADWERLAPVHVDTVVCSWQHALPDRPFDDPPATPAPDDLAYVLFTSGSTGQPKGVMIDHAVLARRLAWLSRAYAVTSQDRSAQATQTSFDPSLIELCLPLVHGASIALAPPGRLLPLSLADFALRHRVTIMAFVPTTLSGFLDGVQGQQGMALRVACCGGEVLAPELARRYLRLTGARLFNVYGPTETCIFATAWECSLDDDSAVLPVGLPVDDTHIHVLDRQLRPVPDGIAGEVFIGGHGLARGYLNQPELTAASFVADPFRSGARLYRSGDKGTLDNQGRLFFQGRLDRQVKLRGYRIELGEIEAALLAIEGVAQAAARKVEHDGHAAIHAWVAPQHPDDDDRLQAALRVRLPDYMVPSVIGSLPVLPTTGTGKIDYAALPDLLSAVRLRSVGRGPANAREAELLVLWEAELGRGSLSVQDNFFDIGGDSLNAIAILAAVERLLGRRIPLYMLSENPTVERLAQALDKQAIPRGLLLQLGPGIATDTLHLAASGHGDLLRFQALADALGSRCDLRMLQPPSDKGFKRIKELAVMYADSIQAQGDAPGFIAGFSIGGIAALETARLLEQRGTPPRGLILIDTVYPKAVWGGTLYWRLFTGLVRLLRLHELSINGRRLGAMINDAGLVSQVRSMRGYRAGDFQGTTTLIKTSGLLRWERPLFGAWRKLMGERLQERRVAGLHGSIFAAGQVQDLATVLVDITRRTP